MSRTVECAYCARDVEELDVPGRRDDEGWARIAAAGHADDCEWVVTRAHTADVARSRSGTYVHEAQRGGVAVKLRLDPDVKARLIELADAAGETLSDCVARLVSKARR